MSINVNVTVDDLDLTTVIGVRQVWDDEGGHDEPITLGDAVVKQLVAKTIETADYTGLKRRVVEIRDEEIRAAVVPLVAEAMAAGIQKTNSYGEPIGQPITLRDLVIEEAKKVIQGVRQDYGRDKPGLATELISKMVHDELRKELAKAIDEERTKVVKAVRDQAATLITEAVTKGVMGK